jgi:hypothetical protein
MVFDADTAFGCDARRAAIALEHGAAEIEAAFETFLGWKSRWRVAVAAIPDTLGEGG